MKHIIKITIFITVASASANLYAAEQKAEAAAQVSELSPADQGKIKEYRNAYELFKEAVLTSRLGAAEEYLKVLKNQFSTLNQAIRDELFSTMHDDTVTYLVGEHPSEPQFFTKAQNLIENIKSGKKLQPPTPQKQKSVPRQYTDTEKKRFDELITSYKKTGATTISTLLKKSITSKRTSLFFYLMSTNPDLKEDELADLLDRAIDEKNNSILRYLLEKFPEIINKPWFMFRNDPVVPDVYSFPLHSAIASRKLPIVELLVNHGADINARDSANKTPLLQAIQLNKAEILEFLINQGAIIDAHNNNPIDTILRQFQDHLSDANQAIQLLRSILESARLVSNPALKDQLVNEPNSQGFKPLCQAAELEWAEGAKLLIKHGADCADPKYKNFLIPLIKEVEKKRAKITFRALKGQTAQEQKLIEPVAKIVREYVEGEQTAAAQPEESEPCTSPETEVD